MKRSWAGEVRNVSPLVASVSEGFREILGICEGSKKDKSGRSAFLRHLVDRGLKGASHFQVRAFDLGSDPRCAIEEYKINAGRRRSRGMLYCTASC
jgi:transposase-like protein